MADLSLDDIFGGVGSMSNQIIQNTKDIAEMKPIVDIAYTPNNKPTAAALGVVNKSGDTMTGALTANGGITITENKEINFTRNTDWFKMGFKNDSDADTDSYAYFETGDNGNEYFKFRSRNGSTTTDWLTIKTDHLRFKGNAVYHAGYKPTAADVGALPLTGGTLTGSLRVNASSGTALLIGTGNTYINKSGGNLYIAANDDGGRVVIESKANHPYVRVGGRDYNIYSAGFKPTPADVGAIPINVNTYSNAALLTRTANYFDGSSPLRNLDYAGFYRTNGITLDSKALPALMIHCPHSSGKAHARGIGFAYGTGWGLTTYRFDSSGVYQGESKIWHDQDKPTWAQLGGNDYIYHDGNYLRTKASTWLMTNGDTVGFMPNKAATHDSSVSYVGNSSWWFKQGWFNEVRGGSVNMTGTGRFEGNMLYVRGDSPTIWWQDSDSRSCAWHCNSNLMYLLRGTGVDATQWDSGPNGRHPATFNLESGDVVFSGNVTAFSDINLKTNVKTVSNAVDKVKKLNGVTYTWKNDTANVGEQAGVIAQEVQEVLPQAVIVDQSSGNLTVAYHQLSALFIEAIKEQQKQIDDLKEQLHKITKV